MHMHMQTDIPDKGPDNVNQCVISIAARERTCRRSPISLFVVPAAHNDACG